MSILKYNRYYVLDIIIPQVKDGVVQKEKVDTIRIEPPLKCEFNITRDVFSDTNKGNFKIYNLNMAHRNMIFQDYMNIGRIVIVEFRAGYYHEESIKQGVWAALPLLLSGRVLNAYSHKQGTDIITEIETIDIDIFNSQSSCTFSAETTREDAIKTLVKDLKNTELGDMAPMPEKLGKPFTVTGDTMSAINAICGGGAFIDNGKLHVLAPNYVRDKVSIAKVTSDRGLLGTPRRREALCEVDVLFEPQITVGQLVELESSISPAQYNGQFKVVGVNHSGSISGADCGTVKTKLNLYAGLELPNSNFVLAQNNMSNGENTITGVNGSETRTLNISNSVLNIIVEVQNYIKKNKKAPTNKTKYPLTKNITWYEVLSKSLSGDPSTIPSLKVLKNLYGTAQAVQTFVDTFYKGKTITINSAWRSPKYNAQVGGAANSQHIQGKAIDLANIDVSPTIMANKAGASGLFGYYQIYGWGIHVDTRNTKFMILANDK